MFLHFVFDCFKFDVFYLIARSLYFFNDADFHVDAKKGEADSIFSRFAFPFRKLEFRGKERLKVCVNMRVFKRIFRKRNSISFDKVKIFFWI